MTKPFVKQTINKMATDEAGCPGYKRQRPIVRQRTFHVIDKSFLPACRPCPEIIADPHPYGVDQIAATATSQSR